MMNDQEREHWDYEMGAQSEEMNCLAEAGMSRHEHNLKVSREIDGALQMGLFVVVSHFTWYCRSTDAMVGEGISLLRTCLRREDAEAECEQYNEHCGDESYAEVLPRKGK